MTTPRPEKPQEPHNQGRKTPEGFDDLISYAKANTKDTIAFVLVIIGIVMLFFDTFWGGLLVGAVAGIYFGAEILKFIRNFNEIFEEQGQARGFIGGAVLFAILISVPTLFLGAAITLAIRHLAVDQK